MSEANFETAQIGKGRWRTLCRGLIVAISGAMYATCLTKTAFVCPDSFSAEVIMGYQQQSAIELLTHGWIVVPLKSRFLSAEHGRGH